MMTNIIKSRIRITRVKYLKSYAVFLLYKAVIRTNGRRLWNSSDLTIRVRFQIDDIN
jgi:hypothetical protein